MEAEYLHFGRQMPNLGDHRAPKKPLLELERKVA